MSMSIILKALKKAEESKTEKETIIQSRAYQVGNKKALALSIMGFIGLVLLFSVWFYWSKGRPVSKAPVKIADKAAEAQPQEVASTRNSVRVATDRAVSAAKKEEPTVAKGPDVNKLREDAVRQIKEKNYSGAEDILRKALAAKPEDPVAYHHLGFALKNQSRYKEASAAYQKAIQLKPDYYEAMNNLAVTYELLGNREKARSLYLKALSIKPSYAEGHLNYGLLLEAEGNIKDAESHYQAFLNLSSDETLKIMVRERLKGP
ncbi:MAG: tetratricopeptide repeat protein [Nitrospirae bacterium]|nr:MAG: tetratricopeptide repeat protein [Nitrospirota bacterium]